MQKGICKRRKKFFGLITVTNRGQIAIPVELRRELKIKTGDKLIVLKRNDNQGINLLKADAIDSFLEKLTKD